MSEAVGAPNEEESLTVLLISQNPSSIRGSISFLNRRGIETQVAETIPDALQTLSQKRPRFVLLSANFQHQKIESMPNLLQSTFNVDVIVFCEKSDRKVDARITNMKARNVIYGQVSGPSILLKIRQILKDVAEPDTSELATKEKKEAHASEDERIKIGGKNSDSGDDEVVLKSHKAGDDSLKRFMQELGEDEPRLESTSLKQSGKTFVAKGRPPKAFASMPNEKKNPRGQGVLKKDPLLAKSPFAIENGPKQNRHAIKESKAEALRQQSSAESVLLNEAHSKLWSCARIALLDVSHGRDVYDLELQDLHSVYLLGINSPTLQATFLLSVGRGRDFPYGAISDLHERFLFHLRSHGHAISADQWELIELNSQLITSSGFAGADFTLSAYSNLMEISISFLDIKRRKPMIERDIPDFSKVSLEDIITEIPVTYDAYVHLPLNNRTIKYLKPGSVFGSSQKEKLSKEGKNHLYIKDDSMSAFHEHHARASLTKEIIKRRDRKKAA